MLFRLVIEWICFIFVSISFPIYIFYLTILIVYRNKRELKGTFFHLCISIGVCDVTSMINNYVGYRFPAWGWGVALYLGGGPPLAKTFICLAWFLRVYQGIGVVLLAVNRSIAIIWPHKYLKFWTPLALKVAIGLQISYGSAFIAPLIFQEFHWQIDNSSRAAVIKFDDEAFKAKYFLVAFLVQTPVVLIIIICYVGMFTEFRRRNNKVTNTQVKNTQGMQQANPRQRHTLSSSKHAQEMKLALMGAIVCVFEIIWFLFILYTSAISPLPTETFFLIYNFLSDIYSGVNPYLMFAFCSAVRDRIKTTLRLKRDTPVMTLRTAIPSNASHISRLHRITSTPQQ